MTINRLDYFKWYHPSYTAMKLDVEHQKELELQTLDSVAGSDAFVACDRHEQHSAVEWILEYSVPCALAMINLSKILISDSP